MVVTAAEPVDPSTLPGEYLWLTATTPLEQANVLAIIADLAQSGSADPAVIAGLILHWEKLDPTVRAQREAVQRFCRELLAHLDEGSR